MTVLATTVALTLVHGLGAFASVVTKLVAVVALGLLRAVTATVTATVAAAVVTSIISAIATASGLDANAAAEHGAAVETIDGVLGIGAGLHLDKGEAGGAARDPDAHDTAVAAELVLEITLFDISLDSTDVKTHSDSARHRKEEFEQIER